MIELCNNRFVQMSSAEDTNATNKKKTSRRNPWGNCSYADLITQAIESSPEKKLTLSQIYDWMIRNIPHFSNQGSSNSSAGWKNSIRHNLSLHKKFLRIRNEGTTGRSSWWTVNKLAGAGRTTRRKNIYKRKKNKSTFKQKTEIFRKVKITGKKLLDCFLSVPNNEDRTRNLQRNISKLMINSPRKRFKSYSSNSSEDNIPIHCNATYDTDTFISYPNSNACQISHSFLSDQSSDSNGIATNYSMNEGSQNKVEIFSAGGNNFYTNCNNEESAVFFKEDYIPKNPSPISIQKNFSVNVSREYFKSPHHLSGSYITSEIGKMPSEICLQNSIYDSKKADLNTYNLPQLSENGIHYLLAESNAFSFNQRTAFDSTRDLLNLTLCNPNDTEIVDQSHKSISTSFPFLNHEDQTGENNFHLDNFCKLDVELISKTKLLLERSDNSDYTEDSVDEEDNLTSDENSTNVSKKQRSGKSIQRLKDFLNEEQKTMPTHMDSNIDSDKYSDHALSPSDSINSCSQAMDSDSFDIPKSFTFTDGFHLEYLLCLEKCSYFSLGFLPDMILNSCETFYPVEVSVSYENENENNMATEELAPQKITFSRFAPVLNKNTNPLFLKPTDAVSKTIKAFINNDIETKNFRQKFPDTVDKLPVLIQLLILNAVNMALLRIQIMSGSQSLTDDVVHTFNELSKTFTLKQMLCFAMEFLILVTNLYYLFVHKVISSQLNLYDTSDLRLPKNTCITNAGECIATYLNMLYVIIDVQFSEKMLNDSKLRHFTSPPKFTSFVSVYLNDPDRTNVGITKEELANTLKLLNQDFDLAFKWNSYSQPNSPYNRIIYAGYFNFPRDADNSKNNSESSYEYPVTCFEANLPSFSKHHTISPNFKIQLKSKCNPVPTNSMENIQIESSNEANAMNLYKPTSTNAVDNNIQINSSHATSEVNEVKRDALSFYEISSPINLGSTLMNFRDDIQLQHTYNPASTNIVEKSVQYESSYDTNAANTNNLISANTVCQRIPLDINYEASETNLEKGDEFQPYQYSSYLNLAPSSFLNAIQLQYADKSIYNVQFDTSHKVNVENNAFYTNILSQPPQIVTTYNDSVTDTSKEDIFQSPGISLSENLTPAADNTFNSIQLDYTGNPTSTNTVDNINMYSSQDATAVNTNNLTSTSLVDHLTQINGNHNTSDKNLGKDSLCQFQEFNNFTHSVSTSNFLKTPQLQCIDHHRSFENNIQVQSNSVISEANKRQGVKHYSKLRNLLMKRSKIFDILPTDLKDIPLYAIPPITEMIYKYIDFYFGTYDKEFDNYLKQLQNCKSIM